MKLNFEPFINWGLRPGESEEGCWCFEKKVPKSYPYSNTKRRRGYSKLPLKHVETYNNHPEGFVKSKWSYWEALDLAVHYHGKVAAADTSQNLDRMPVVVNPSKPGSQMN